MRTSFGRILIDFARPFTLIVPAVGVAVGALVGAVLGEQSLASELHGQALWLVALMGALAAALLNAGSNTINQVCDRRIDALSKPERPIPSGRIGIPAAILVALALYLSALVVLVIARVHLNGPAIAIFLAALIATLLYSVPPFRTRRFLLLANITIAIPRGFLLIVAGVALVIDPMQTLEPWLLGCGPGLYLLGAASTKDFADMEGDARDGVRTLPIVLGQERAIRLISPFLVAPFALLALVASAQLLGVIQIVHGDARVLAGLGVLLTTWGGRVARMLLRDPSALSTTENHPAWKQMYLMMLIYYLGVALAYGLSA